MKWHDEIKDSDDGSYACLHAVVGCSWILLSDHAWSDWDVRLPWTGCIQSVFHPFLHATSGVMGSSVCFQPAPFAMMALFYIQSSIRFKVRVLEQMAHGRGMHLPQKWSKCMAWGTWKQTCGKHLNRSFQIWQDRTLYNRKKLKGQVIIWQLPIKVCINADCNRY